MPVGATGRRGRDLAQDAVLESVEWAAGSRRRTAWWWCGRAPGRGRRWATSWSTATTCSGGRFGQSPASRCPERPRGVEVHSITFPTMSRQAGPLSVVGRPVFPTTKGTRRGGAGGAGELTLGRHRARASGAHRRSTTGRLRHVLVDRVRLARLDCRPSRRAGDELRGLFAHVRVVCLREGAQSWVRLRPCLLDPERRRSRPLAALGSDHATRQTAGRTSSSRPNGAGGLTRRPARAGPWRRPSAGIR